MRKGQLDVQFNWIFVLIAGAVILGMFFKVAMTQQQISQDKAAIQLQNDFDAITTAALQSKDTIQTIPIPSLGLHFDCSDCSCAIKFGRFSLPFDDRSIFTPDAIEGADAKLWTLDWKAPFRVTNMLYITNDMVKFYIVGQGAIKDRIKAGLPAEVNAEYIDGYTAITPENENRIVFVIINGQLPGPDVLHKWKSAVDVHAVALSTNPSGVSTVKFYHRDKTNTFAIDGAEQQFLGDELMFAAIMAQDGEAYSCNLRTALKRLLGVTLVYDKRATSLIDAVPANSGCRAIYQALVTGPAGPLVALKTATTKALDDGTLQRLQNASVEMAIDNEQLLRLSCPTVY